MLDAPGRAAPEDRTDPGLLGMGKHGAAIVAERHRVNQQPHELDNTHRTQRAATPWG